MNNGQLHDVHAAWTLQFKDGQLFRLTSNPYESSQVEVLNGTRLGV